MSLIRKKILFIPFNKSWGGSEELWFSGISYINPDFFDLYNQLFYEIPTSGDNSHETLIKKSSDYINYQPTDDTIQALLNEINSLLIFIDI